MKMLKQISGLQYQVIIWWRWEKQVISLLLFSQKNWKGGIIQNNYDLTKNKYKDLRKSMVKIFYVNNIRNKYKNNYKWVSKG